MPKRLKSCKNAGAGQTVTRDVFHWRTSQRFLFYRNWRWIIKIKSLLILSRGFTFRTLQTLLPDKTVFQESAVCARDSDRAENWHLHHLQAERRGTQLIRKNKGTQHVTCNREDPWIHSRNGNYFISTTAKLRQSEEIYVHIQDSVRIILSNHH